MKSTEKYLLRSAEPEVNALQSWPENARYNHVVVIPAYDEQADFFQRLLGGQLQENNALAIIVVNRPDNTTHCEANVKLIHTITQTLPPIWQPEPTEQSHCELRGNNSFGVLLVNRETRPIPYRQGVGLARKIGSDLAAALISAGNITSPWIHSTDADAHLPVEYFSSAEQLSNQCSAAVYHFEHLNNGSEIGNATQWYQQSLHYYRDGLAQAGSPYAFFTIGSTLVFRCQAYCQAHGFPKRSGGEDFYLLNKLAKLGAVETLPAVISLEARVSHRVPFGTGPASARIQQSMNDNQPLLSYNPEIFTELGRWLMIATETIQNSGAIIDPLNLQKLHSDSRKILMHQGIDHCWLHLNQSQNTEWRLRHFHHWFDAFRTLKFIHYLQDHSFPPQPLEPQNP